MAFIQCDFTSQMLGFQTKINVIIPQEKPNNQMPVVYLLHGLTDNCSGWYRYTSLERYALKHNVCVVMPEVQRSFYTDMNLGVKYFSYITKELPQICKQLFSLSVSKENSYIMGLSMGGYGALKSALTYENSYKGCAVFSSVADINEYINSVSDDIDRINEFKAIFGESLKNKDNLFYLSQKKCAQSLPFIYITCGKQDTLYSMNIKLENHLENLNIPFKHEEWDGEHSWDFWDKSLQKAFDLFFN